jgi:hypothetical protein
MQLGVSYLQFATAVSVVRISKGDIEACLDEVSSVENDEAQSKESAELENLRAPSRCLHYVVRSLRFESHRRV